MASKNQAQPDTDKEHTVKTSRLVTFPMVITFLLAMASGTWAIRAEVDNYRQKNTTARVNAQEILLREVLDANAARDALDARIITLVEGGNERMTIFMEANNQALEDIKTDIRELRNGR